MCYSCTWSRARVTRTLKIADHNPNIAVSYTINGRAESPSMRPVWTGVSGVIDLGGVNLSTSHINVIPSLWIRSNCQRCVTCATDAGGFGHALENFAPHFPNPECFASHGFKDFFREHPFKVGHDTTAAYRNSPINLRHDIPEYRMMASLTVALAFGGPPAPIPLTIAEHRYLTVSALPR